MASINTEELEKQCLRKGAAVEVSLEDPGFRGSWFTATVIRPVSKRTRKILVEYDNLTYDDDTSKSLRELVDVFIVRPVPPRESTRRKFHFGEEVDAFYEDGWWEGVITAVHGDRYSVYFRCSKEQIEFGGSDLRLHREWVYGNWVPPLEQEQVEEGDDGDGDGDVEKDISSQ